MQFDLPDLDTVIEIHKIVLDSFGGLEGVPHPEYIKSAINRPQSYIAYYTNCDLHLVAAIILDSIVRYHAFADGNKRTALLTTIFVYRINGYKVATTLLVNEKLEKLVLDVADSKKTLSVRQVRARLKRVIEANLAS